MHACRSMRHYWLNQDDARKCCNGYVRILVMSSGGNQQICAGVPIGRTWMPTPAAAPHAGESVSLDSQELEHGAPAENAPEGLGAAS